MLIYKRFVYLSIFIVFISCSQKKIILGDWGAIENGGTYSELFFSEDKIQIHDEIAGTLQFQTYRIEKDSLKTSVLKYKIVWVNNDSINLISDSFSLNLKRIKTGLKLSEYNNEKNEAAYLKSFFERMYKQKGLDSNPVELPNSDRKIKEEVIEIEKNK